MMRLLLALSVLLVHCADLSRSPSLSVIRTFLNSRIAVEGFFAISGCLVFASYDRCTSLRQYWSKRARRILPGYWLATLFCVAIAFASHHYRVFAFLLADLSFLIGRHIGIDGVFAGNPTTSAMDGALWTIKIEVMFYLCVPVISWLCDKWKRDVVLGLLILLSLIYQYFTVGDDFLRAQFPSQLSYFLTGTLIYYHLAFFRRYGAFFVTAAAVTYVIYGFTGWFFPRPIAVSVMVLGACFLFPHIEGPAKWGDFSFGIYVLHFPIIQLLVAAGSFRAHAWLSVCAVLGIVSIASVFSWFLVEKPALGPARSKAAAQALAKSW